MSETTVTGPGGEVVQRTAAQQVVAQVRSEQFMEQVAMALPGDVPPDRFVRATVTALLANPDIANADRDSLFTALLKSAQDGLLPDGREAALVTFNNKKKGIVEAQYLPMIQGFRKIAGEQGWSIRTNVVHQNDEFSVEVGLEPNIIHRPVAPGVDPGPAIAAYAVGAHGDGRREIEVMSAADIERVKQTSKAKDFGPWKDWPERMWEKTVGRRLFKKLPLGDKERVARVVSASASQIEPEDAIASLYGREEQAALMSPEGVVVDHHVDWTGETERIGERMLREKAKHNLIARADIGGSAGEQWDDDVVSDSERLTASADSEASPAGADSAAEPSRSPGAAMEVTPQDSAAAVSRVPEAAPVVTADEEPVIPMPEQARPAVDPKLLAAARKARPPMGSYQDKSLDWIVKTPAANEWLVYALKKWPPSTAFGKLLHAIVQSERPELLTEQES